MTKHKKAAVKKTAKKAGKKKPDVKKKKTAKKKTGTRSRGSSTASKKKAKAGTRKTSQKKKTGPTARPVKVKAIPKVKAIDERNLTQAQLCRILDKKPSQINEWKRKPGFPVGVYNGKTSYDAGQVLRWVIDYRLSSQRDQLLGKSEEREHQQKMGTLDMQNKEQTVRKLKIKNDRDEKELLLIDHVRTGFAEIARRIRTVVGTLKRKLGEKIVKEFETALNKAEEDFNKMYPVPDGRLKNQKENK